MLLQLLLSGVAQGSIYALVALGMTILYRATGIVSFAQGDMFMLGAFLVYLLLQFGGLHFAFAAVVALAFMYAIGIAVERGFIRPMGRASHMYLAMMTVALSFLFRGVARSVWGREVLPMPPIFSYPPIEFAGLIITVQDLIITGVTALLVVAFFVFFHRTRLGRIAQAASQNQRGAALVGINVPGFHRNMWGVAAVLGAIAGILVAPISLLYPDMGAHILIKAFAAMTLGGFGHLGGAVLGGIAVGLLEQLAGGYVSTALIDVSAYLVIIVVLLVRPQGIFGRKETQRV